MTRFDLTEEQLEILEPMFQRAREEAEENGAGMIVGQIFRDGVRVGFYDRATSTAILRELDRRGFKQRQQTRGSSWDEDE